MQLEARGPIGPLVLVEDEETKRKRRLLRQYVACDLLLARLYKHHPDHAMAALKGVEPHIVDLEPPEAPAVTVERIVPIPVASAVDEIVGHQPTIREILLIVCQFYGVRPMDVCAHRRHKLTTLPRKIAFYLSRELTLHALTTIGNTIGRRDHTTVLRQIVQIANRIKTDERLADEIAVLKLRIADKLLNKAA